MSPEVSRDQHSWDRIDLMEGETGHVIETAADRQGKQSSGRLVVGYAEKRIVTVLNH